MMLTSPPRLHPSPDPGAGTATDPDGGPDFLAYVRTRDRAALERALAIATPRAYTQAWRTLGNQADAEDAVQEAMIQLLRGVEGYHGRIPFAAWLGRLVQVACWQQRRQAVRRHRRDLAAMSTTTAFPATPTAIGSDAEIASQVRAAVQQLGADERTAIELHYFAGVPQAAAAAALGLREGTLAMRLSRARDRLRRLLSQRGVALGAAALLGVLSGTSAPAADTAFLERMQTLARTPPTPVPAWQLHAGSFLARHAKHLLLGSAATLAVVVGCLALTRNSPARADSLPITRNVQESAASTETRAFPAIADAKPQTIRQAQDAPRAEPDTPPVAAPALAESIPNVTLSVQKMEVKHVVQFLFRMTNVTIDLINIPDQTISVDWQEIPFPECLAKLGKLCDAKVEQVDGKHWRLSGVAMPRPANF